VREDEVMVLISIVALASAAIGLVVGFVLGAVFHAWTKSRTFTTTRHEFRVNGDVELVEEDGKVLFETPGAKARCEAAFGRKQVEE
jgi:Na+/glutamate symporter